MDHKRNIRASTVYSSFVWGRPLLSPQRQRWEQSIIIGAKYSFICFYFPAALISLHFTWWDGSVCYQQLYVCKGSLHGSLVSYCSVKPCRQQAVSSKHVCYSSYPTDNYTSCFLSHCDIKCISFIEHWHIHETEHLRHLHSFLKYHSGLKPGYDR